MSHPEQNRLKDAASAYLRSAAHQPIDWHEWGPEAFARARAEDKPILLDVGAVWCHWCHVMDRESYESAETAAIIREHFIAVKVDRDERPDVDARYQAAISAISGQGGWPLTGFLTPDGKPFFGGTYFPPDDRFGRPGFPRILLLMAEAYRTQRDKVDQSAATIADAVAKAESFTGAKSSFEPAVVDELVDATVRLFDLRNGGFGRAPKFPHPTAIDLLLSRYAESREPHLLTVVTQTLDRMARGGVYDQLAGGFHRYSVDERWLVPHFEKMSYDNSEILRNYVHAWQVTGNAEFRRTAESIVGWVQAELSDAERGGFYASQDADASLEDDGDYFTWTLDELRACCTEDEARAAALHFDIEAQGEMHHNPAKNVLWIARSEAEVARQLGTEESEARRLLESARRKMLAARWQRPRPYVDTTIYTGWNGMFVSAFLLASRAFAREDCRAFALRTLERILAEAWDERRGFAHRVGGPRLDGTLDDHVFTAAALLDAYECTLERRFFDFAELAMAFTLTQFWDDHAGGFFDRATDAAPLGGLDVRRKPLQDSPTPSANPMAAMVLDRLHGYTGKPVYRERAEQTLEAFAGIAPQFGMFGASYGLAASLHSRAPMQVVVAGAGGDSRANVLEAAAVAHFRWGKAVLRITPEQAAGGALVPALAETIPHLDAAKPQALVCVNHTCFPPATEEEELRALLSGRA